jgi:hypothetical protein
MTFTSRKIAGGLKSTTKFTPRTYTALAVQTRIEEKYLNHRDMGGGDYICDF